MWRVYGIEGGVTELGNRGARSCTGLFILGAVAVGGCTDSTVPAWSDAGQSELDTPAETDSESGLLDASPDPLFANEAGTLLGDAGPVIAPPWDAAACAAASSETEPKPVNTQSKGGSDVNLPQAGDSNAAPRPSKVPPDAAATRDAGARHAVWDASRPSGAVLRPDAAPSKWDAASASFEDEAGLEGETQAQSESTATLDASEPDETSAATSEPDAATSTPQPTSAGPEAGAVRLDAGAPEPAPDAATSPCPPSEPLSLAGYPVVLHQDARSTQCATLTATGICVAGTVFAHGNDPATNWGVAMTVYLAQALGNGDELPFDAAGAGITGVGMHLVSTAGVPSTAHLALTRLDDPSISNPLHNYERNRFIWSGNGTGTGYNMIIEAAWSEFALPSSTLLDVDADGTPDPLTALDASRLQALLVTVSSDLTDIEYDYCLSGLHWLD